MEDWYDWEFTWEAEDEPLAEYYRVTERWKSGPKGQHLAYPYQYEISDFTPLSCFDISCISLGSPYVSTEGVWRILDVNSVSDDGEGTVTVMSNGDRYDFDYQGRLVYQEGKPASNTGSRWIFEYTYY